MSKIIIIFVVVTLVGIGAVVAINKNAAAKEKEAAEQAATTCVRMMFNCKMLIAVYPW